MIMPFMDYYPGALINDLTSKILVIFYIILTVVGPWFDISGILQTPFLFNNLLGIQGDIKT